MFVFSAFFLFFYLFIQSRQDGHEICFVGEEGFRQLSAVDPKGEKLLTEAVEKDKSDEGFASKGGKAAA